MNTSSDGEVFIFVFELLRLCCCLCLSFLSLVNSTIKFCLPVLILTFPCVAIYKQLIRSEIGARFTCYQDTRDDGDDKLKGNL